MDISRAQLARIASEDPDLAARVLLAGLPAHAHAFGAAFACDVTVDGAGTARLGNGTPAPLFHATTDARGLMALWTGESPMGLMLRGRVRVRGRRRHVGKLAALGRIDGVKVDALADVRLLPWAVEPGWTAGHAFRVKVADSWVVEARSGERLRVSEGGEAESAVDASLAHTGGALLPAVLLGRWVQRALGRDEVEQVREERQRLIQASRAGVPGPLHELLARGEAESWSPASIDLTADREQWVLLPSAAQNEVIALLAPVAAATERMAAGIGALLPAAPGGEHELVLMAQAAELGRHVALLDRVASEVLALDGADLRARMRELRSDDGDARALARRIATVPDGLDPWVDGVAAWHIGCGQRAAAARAELHARLDGWAILPGLMVALRFAERDGRRHLEFGGHVLDHAFRRRPADRDTVERRLVELAAVA